MKEYTACSRVGSLAGVGWKLCKWVIRWQRSGARLGIWKEIRNGGIICILMKIWSSQWYYYIQFRQLQINPKKRTIGTSTGWKLKKKKKDGVNLSCLDCNWITNATIISSFKFVLFSAVHIIFIQYVFLVASKSWKVSQQGGKENKGGYNNKQGMRIQ